MMDAQIIELIIQGAGTLAICVAVTVALIVTKEPDCLWGLLFVLLMW